MFTFGSKKATNVMENISIDSNFHEELLGRFISFLEERDEKFSEWMDSVVSFHDLSKSKGFAQYQYLTSDGFIIKSLTEDTFKIVTTDGNMYNATIISDEFDGYISVKVVNYDTPSVELIFTTDEEEATLLIHGDNFVISWCNGRTSVEPTHSDGRITAKFILDAPLGLKQLYEKLASDSMQNYASACTLQEVFGLSQFLDGFGNQSTLDKSSEELDLEGDHISFSSDESEDNVPTSSDDYKEDDVTPDVNIKQEEVPTEKSGSKVINKDFETREFTPTFKNPEESDDFYDHF